LNISRKQIVEYYEDRFKEIAQRCQSTQGRSTERVDELSVYYAEAHRTGIHRLITKHRGGGGQVLDLGCGAGQYFTILTQSFDTLVGTDISMTALRLARENRIGHFLVCANASEQPFRAATFDFVLCSEVIEHVRPEESEQVFRCICSVLKPGGYLLITTPNAWDLGRLVYEAQINLLSSLLGVDRFRLKARMYKLALRLTGRHSSVSESISKHGFVEHINVLSPKELRRQLEVAGFQVVWGEARIIRPMWEHPFRRLPVLARLLCSLDDKVLSKSQLLQFASASNLFFVAKKCEQVSEYPSVV